MDTAFISKTPLSQNHAYLVSDVIVLKRYLDNPFR